MIGNFVLVFGVWTVLSGVASAASLNRSEYEEFRRQHAESVLSYMDFSYDPCDDFFQYACGNYINLYPFQPGQLSSRAASLLTKKVDNVLKNEVHSSSQDHQRSSSDDAVSKMRNFYASCVDDRQNDAQSAEVIKSFIAKFGKWPVLDRTWKEADFDLFEMMVSLSAYDFVHLFPLDVRVSLNKSDTYVLSLSASENIKLEYTEFVKGENSTQIQAYKTFIIETMELLGARRFELNSFATNIINFEHVLKGIVASTGAQSIQELSVPLHRLKQVTPEFDWDMYFTRVLGKRVGPSEILYVDTIKYFKKLFEFLHVVEKRSVSNWILWKIFESTASYLGGSFAQLDSEFKQAVVARKGTPPLEKKCLDLTTKAFENVVSHSFVKAQFDEKSKAEVFEIVKDIQDEWLEQLNQKDWIEESTRRHAEEKLRSISFLIGYGESHLDERKLNEEFANVRTDGNNFLDLASQINAKKVSEKYRKYGTTVDKTEWITKPYFVDGTYAPSRNQITFTAAYLQSPVYHKFLPRAWNHGAVGRTIGHEITHGFDSKGRKFDKDGALRDWWDESTSKKFDEKVKCFVEQFNTYKLDGHSVKGDQTAAENISDLGGLRVSFLAYQKWLQRNMGSKLVDDETLPGLAMNSDQLFFLAFAQQYCGKIRPEAVAYVLGKETHAPLEVRVRGTLKNSNEFAQAFQCTTGTQMNPIHKCELW